MTERRFLSAVNDDFQDFASGMERSSFVCADFVDGLSTSFGKFCKSGV